MTQTGTAGATTWPWKHAALWLLFLAPFFFLSYGFANQLAAGRAITASLVFDWERSIPYVPWTIVPYWSIDLLYGISFLFCRTRHEVNRHALRLLTVQIISVTCFILFPLHFTFDRPATDGVFGWMFDILMGFDKPYNQAPSLHIGLLIVIWARFSAGTRGYWRLLTHLWAVLICISVLTTYQHHFIDVPTGALVGLLSLWLWPEAATAPPVNRLVTDNPYRRRMALRYLSAALGLALLAGSFTGATLWLIWPAVALAVVALIYAVSGAAGFQKRDGRLSLAVKLLLAPYLLGAWLNSRYWTRRHPSPDYIIDNIWLGRLPTWRAMTTGGFAALYDLTAELPAPQGTWHYLALPMLDLVPPDAAQLAKAAQDIESLRVHGRVLVCCALGYSRSACAVAAWLLASGKSLTVDDAIALITARRPQVMLGAAHRSALATCVPAASSKTDS